MSEELPDFDPDMICPKCLGELPAVTFSYGVDELLLIVCNCGYAWRTKTADATKSAPGPKDEGAGDAKVQTVLDLLSCVGERRDIWDRLPERLRADIWINFPEYGGGELGADRRRVHEEAYKNWMGLTPLQSPGERGPE